MNRVYEIFEVLPNGSPQKVNVVWGLEFARLKLRELASQTRNECFATDHETHQIVAQMNVPPKKRSPDKSVSLPSTS